MVTSWVNAGAVLQVDAESLLGLWGSAAKRCAEELLTAGQVGAMASDAHSCSRRPPRLTAALARALELIGSDADLLVRATPEALLSGTFAGLPARAASAASPDPGRSLLRRLLGRR